MNAFIYLLKHSLKLDYLVLLSPGISLLDWSWIILASLLLNLSLHVHKEVLALGVKRLLVKWLVVIDITLVD